MSLCLYACFFYCYGDHRDLHVLTHSFPTRRSSDLSEWGEVPEATAALIAETRSAGGRVVATGTTTLRILEAAARADGSVPAWSGDTDRSEEHTSELQSLMRHSYAVFCLKKKTQKET